MIYRQCFLTVVIVTLISLVAAGLSVDLPARIGVNGGMVQIIKAVDCPASWFVCRASPFSLRSPFTLSQQAHLDTAVRWLGADALQPSKKPVVQLYQATVQYVRGDREAAADILRQLPPLPTNRNSLLATNRAEHFLVQARLFMQRQQWETAIDSFRQAATLDPYSLQPVDDRDWYRALAGAEMEQAAARPNDPRPRYLTGKYLVLAGDYSAAIPWLQAARSDSSAAQLSPTERGWLDVYLARALRASSRPADALAVLTETIGQVPDFRLAHLELFSLAQEMADPAAAQQAEAALQALGPTYRLGQHTAGFAADAPGRLDNGWTLIGYEVDEQALEQVSAVALTLWWQGPANAAPPAGFHRVGPYWLQWQTVHNLFVNAGFEWGMDDRGVPVGHAREYYGTPRGSLEVITAELNGSTTHVLAGHTTADHDRVALVSFPLAVDSTGHYLMAAWLQDSDRLSRVGRLCVERRFGPEIGYYVSPDRTRPSQAWVHVANLAPASPDRSPISCSAFLLNSNSQDTALWDQVLFARVEVP